MNKLGIIVKREYLMSIRKRSFAVTTILFPIIFGILIFVQYMFSGDMRDGVNENQLSQITAHDIYMIFSAITPLMLWFYVLLYGTQLFNAVRYEKSNRIAEIMLSTVSSSEFMLGKIIAIGLVGITQIAIWIVVSVIALTFIVNEQGVDLTVLYSLDFMLIVKLLLFGIFSFCGGYLLYGALYAGMGSLLDSDNDNQQYIGFITILLVMAMYSGLYSAENPGGDLSVWSTYIPFTSPFVLIPRMLYGIAWWEVLLSYFILAVSDFIIIRISGKIYAAGILLKGKRIGFSDIISFIRK